MVGVGDRSRALLGGVPPEGDDGEGEPRAGGDGGGEAAAQEEEPLEQAPHPISLNVQADTEDYQSLDRTFAAWRR
eukprot:455286-Pyramimonas_sp.AAC.1